MKIQSPGQYYAAAEMKNDVFAFAGFDHPDIVQALKQTVEKLENELHHQKKSIAQEKTLTRFFWNYNFESESLH